MTTKKSAPTESQNAYIKLTQHPHYNRNRTPPPFPANGKQAHHARAALVLMLKGGKWDQYEYNRQTGFPCTDYRTRISELYRSGWPIERAFHCGVDHEGQAQRCKNYWMNTEAIRELFQQFPDFEARCRLLMEKGVANE